MGQLDGESAPEWCESQLTVQDHLKREHCHSGNSDEKNNGLDNEITLRPNKISHVEKQEIPLE